jgi:hypothetical protein
MRLYRDGSLLGVFAPIGVTGAGGTDTRLGRQFDPFSEYFHGQMDDLWIFNGALTATEVHDLAIPEPASAGIFIAAATTWGLGRRRKACRANF